MRALLLPLVMAVSLSAGPSDEVVRTFSEQYGAGGIASISLDVPVGEVEISAGSSDRVELDVVLECDDGWGSSRCRDRADQIRLESRERNGRLSIELEGYSTWRNRGLEVHLELRLPPRIALELDMGIGEVDIRDLQSDVTVDLGIGEVFVGMDESLVAKVVLDAGIGETSLRTSEGRSSVAGLFTSELAWDEGGGEATIRVDLGIGEINVRIQ